MSFIGEQIRANRWRRGGEGGIDTRHGRLCATNSAGGNARNEEEWISGGGSVASAWDQGESRGEEWNRLQPEERKVRIDPADRLVAEQSSTL